MTVPPIWWYSSMAYWATLPKPWTLARGVRRLDAQLLAGLAQVIDHAVARGLGATQRAAHAHRLAGDHAGVVAAVDRLVLVEHPEHVLRRWS